MAIQQIQHGHGATIYPSDTESISDYLQVYGRSTCLYIGTGGNLRVLTVGGDDVTFRNVQSGQFLPVMVTKVFLTGTTASNITVVDMGPGRFRGLLFDYSKRVSFDGGVVEAGSCVDAVSGLLLNASLLLIPSGYKGGKLYSEIPTNGNGDLTWTRGSDAFRTNASGLLQRVPWNLFTYSEELDSATWFKTTGVSITANATSAPNDTLTADRVIGATGTGTWADPNTLGKNVGGLITSTLYTASIYLRSTSTSSQVTFQFRDQTTGSANSIVCNLTSSWQRFNLSRTTGASSTGLAIILSNSTADFFAWGAQLVEGTTAQTYLPITDRLNFPRLSYMYGSCPALLLEPQRTNLMLYSQQLDDATWGRTSVSVTANQATAPDGTNTMDLLVFSATSGRLTQGISTTSGATYTFSIWLATQSGTQTVEIGNINLGVWQTVTVTTTPTRFSVTQVASSTTRFPGIQSTGAYSILAWGAQLEAGAYPTTYISTTSATATRVADSFSRNNIYTNGLISASGGTWFVELRNTIPYIRDTFAQSLFIGGNSTGVGGDGFAFTFGGSTANRPLIRKYVGAVESLVGTLTSDNSKVAIKWNGSTADVFINGTKVTSATSFAFTNLQFVGGVGSAAPVFIQQMALFPTPLSDTDCQLLTAL